MIGALAVLQVAAAAGSLVIDDCRPTPDQNDIIVCGSRRGYSPYRLPKLPREYDEKPLRAETDAIPGVHTRVHVESGQMPDGNVAKRLMLTFSLPF